MEDVRILLSGMVNKASEKTHFTYAQIYKVLNDCSIFSTIKTYSIHGVGCVLEEWFGGYTEDVRIILRTLSVY